MKNDDDRSIGAQLASPRRALLKGALTLAERRGVLGRHAAGIGRNTAEPRKRASRRADSSIVAVCERRGAGGRYRSGQGSGLHS